MRKINDMRSSTSVPAVPFLVIWYGISNIQWATWGCSAFHPHVSSVKLPRQSMELQFDCVYTVLRGISKQFLTPADCLKKRVFKGFLC